MGKVTEEQLMRWESITFFIIMLAILLLLMTD